MADEDFRRSESHPQRTSAGFKTFFTVVIVLLLIGILLLATGVVKMSPVGGP
jgi:type III secretory pathway component EscR